jgi:site-specific DNA-methyltransferase (adenine-specific)
MSCGGGVTMDEKKDGAIPRLLDEIVINYGGGCCLYNSDCLDILRTLPDGSVDMILQDPPYNMTACKWECEIDFPVLWKEWERVVKANGAIIMTASQPFTTDLISSKRTWFKYEWIWNKQQAGNFTIAKQQPLRKHENILVFYAKQPTYNPQMEKAKVENIRPTIDCGVNSITNLTSKHSETYSQEYNYPSSVIDNFHGRMAECNSVARQHPTQKPVDLFRYLIRTYTNEGETVFDGYGGSGTTAVACIKENRKYIVCEKEAEYIEVAKKRIDEATRQGNLFSAVGCCPHDL